MNFLENNEITGHLEITKVFSDGSREVVLEDHNIITSGMGLTMASYLGAGVAEGVSSFQINHWQLGSGASAAPSGYMVVGRADLVDSFDASTYGTASKSSFEVVNQPYMTSGGTSALDNFIEAEQRRTVTRVAPNSIAWRLLIDENSCNGKTINEAAIFSRNPTTAVTNLHYMVAYRAFAGIPKASQFALDFRWRIDF